MPLNLLRGYGRQPRGPVSRPVREGNDCNLPGGESDGGQFGRNDDPRCVGGPGASDRIRLSPTGRMAGEGRPSTSQITAYQTERQQTARITALPPDRRSAFFQALAAALRKQGVERLSPEAMDALLTQHEPTTAPAPAPAPAPKPDEPKLTSQDTKKSSTKQTSYEADDNITGRPVGRKGESIFGAGITNTTIAHEMTKYLSEGMHVSIQGHVEGAPEGVTLGPDPNDPKTRELYDEAMEAKSEQMARSHEENSKTAFDNYAYASHREVGAVVRGVLIDNIKFHLENPELTPWIPDASQPAFDLGDDPAFDPKRDLLTPERVIEILDEHNLLTRAPGSTNSESVGYDDGIATRIESELANGNFTQQFDAQDVLSALFDPSHEEYDNEAVASARAQIRALRPTEEAFEDKGREIKDAYKDMVDEGVQNAFSGQDYLHNFLTQDEPRNALAERWYRDTAQGQNAPMNNTSFTSWYTSQYGHKPLDWAQIKAEQETPRTATVKDGEQKFEFHGDDGSQVTRVFTREFGRLSVYHSYFTNHGPAGQGKALMRGQMELYEKLGVEEMTTTANISTGSYAWARYGFLASDPESLAYEVRNRVASVMSSSPALRGLRTKIEDVIDSSESDSDLPWQIADMRVTGTPAEMHAIAERFMTSRLAYVSFDSKEARRWDADMRKDADNGTFNIGKVLMIGHNWSARFDMSDATQRARMRDYIGDWTQPADGSGPLTAETPEPAPAAKPEAPRGRAVLRPGDAPLGTRVERMTNTGRVTATISDQYNDGDPYFRYDRDDQKTIDKVDSGWADGEWREKLPTPKATKAPAAPKAPAALPGRPVKIDEVPIGTRLQRMSNAGLVTVTVGKNNAAPEDGGVYRYYRYDEGQEDVTQDRWNSGWAEPSWRTVPTEPVPGTKVRRVTDVPVGTRLERRTTHGTIRAEKAMQPSGPYYRMDTPQAYNERWKEPYWRVAKRPRKP